ncbi:MAG: fibronectin type III domain-containing protein [Ferruginibacter sp.]
MKVLFYSVLVTCFLFFVSCKKDSNNTSNNNNNNIPILSLGQVTNARAYSAQIPPCSITGSVIDQGYCISTSANPDTSYRTFNIIAHDGVVPHLHFTELLPNTTYYLRAFASNIDGLGYSNEVSFTTAATALAIGEDYAGGIVFYIDPSGNHGLVASAFSAFDTPWQNGTASGAAFTTGSAINTGKANTNTILDIYVLRTLFCNAL